MKQAQSEVDTPRRGFNGVNHEVTFAAFLFRAGTIGSSAAPILLEPAFAETHEPAGRRWRRPKQRFELREANVFVETVRAHRRMGRCCGFGMCRIEGLPRTTLELSIDSPSLPVVKRV